MSLATKENSDIVTNGKAQSVINAEVNRKVLGAKSINSGVVPASRLESFGPSGSPKDRKRPLTAGSLSFGPDNQVQFDVKRPKVRDRIQLDDNEEFESDEAEDEATDDDNDCNDPEKKAIRPVPMATFPLKYPVSSVLKRKIYVRPSIVDMDELDFPVAPQRPLSAIEEDLFIDMPAKISIAPSKYIPKFMEMYNKWKDTDVSSLPDLDLESSDDNVSSELLKTPK